MQQDAVIVTRGLSKNYGDVTALRELDLEVPRNSIFGFLGPNGAGKTTTIKLILGLIQPSAGSASVFGHDIVGDTIAVRRQIGYLAQEPRYYEHLSARETLRFSARFFYDGPSEAIERRVQETLELVGLSDRADRPIKGFSGGERQRLGIAQAQVHDPDLLILDEPAASLDPMGRRDVLRVMAELRERCTIFYSTHILDDVQRVSDTVAILNHGELVAQAPITELLAGGKDTIVYAVELRGDAAGTLERCRRLDWVAAAEASDTGADGVADLHITVTDGEAAERLLLREILSDDSVRVLKFGRRVFHLEDVFMNVVDGHNGD